MTKRLHTPVQLSPFPSVPAIHQSQTPLKENEELREQVKAWKQYSEELERHLLERDQILQDVQKFWAAEENRHSVDEDKDCRERNDSIHDRPATPQIESELDLVDVILLDEAAPQSPASQIFDNTARILDNKWVLEPGINSELVHAEAFIKEGRMQKALAYLDICCPSTSGSPSIYINATLLKSAALRCAEAPQRALELAEIALYISNLNDLPNLVSKSQYYRGLAFYDLGLFAEAKVTLVRAASILYYARDITNLTHEAERRRNLLPLGARGRYLAHSFEIIPSKVAVSGFGARKP